jgi:hypothetical protein
MVWTGIAFADCDLSRFRWECELPAQAIPNTYQSSLVFCRDVPVYVTKERYNELLRYQRAHVNMDLMINGEFVAGPCVPGRL